MSLSTQRDSEIAVELAQTFVGMLNEQYPGWSRAFFRFNASDQRRGGQASFVREGRVDLFSAFASPESMNRMLRLGDELWVSQRSFKVLLLVVQGNLEYTIHFEAKDERRWAISKMDGGTGIPDGVT